MTEALVTELRKYIEDETAPYMVSDTIILQKLNASRNYIEGLQIYAEDYFNDNVSTVYPLGYAGIMNLILTDGDDNVIDTDNYTVDVENGIIDFDTSPPYTIPDIVYAQFNYCDFYEAISELWKYRAALSRFSGKVQLGDEVLPLDANSREYCIMKYWDFKQSKNIQMER
jgi:hypothetical protein